MTLSVPLCSSTVLKFFSFFTCKNYLILPWLVTVMSVELSEIEKFFKTGGSQTKKGEDHWLSFDPILDLTLYSAGLVRVNSGSFTSKMLVPSHTWNSVHLDVSRVLQRSLYGRLIVYGFFSCCNYTPCIFSKAKGFVHSF